ncbi:class F sortase [Cellulomonas cellasea]|uniref:Class F sortase n=1 Tax=Cellulomonas cellasea TaxID=43670 RepID=A0A7W4UCK7_9CELL|nr:class F sortase [Cellulomonas cellasea]MBB2921720.1 hypothetical protein [Cellulomonas cellasea]
MTGTRPTGPPAGRVPASGAPAPTPGRLGVRLGAAVGVAAVAVGGWLALQPGEFAAADAGVAPGPGTTSGASGDHGPTGAAASPPVRGDAGPRPAEPSWISGLPASPAPGAPAPAPAAPQPVAVPAAPQPVAVPVHLEVAGRDRPVEVVPVGVEPTGAIVVPDDPDVLGWWQSGPGVGAPAGSTVLVGHVDVPGDLGVMRALAVLPVDATLTLADRQGGSATYRVAARRTFSKEDGLPTDLFRTDGSPQLVLVTCGGAFDTRTGHYADNVVVYAVPA